MQFTLQCLTDELQALQMAYSSLEGSLRRLQEDNQELVSRWMALKARDADRVNEENAQFLREKQEKVRSDLQRAATEDVGPFSTRYFFPLHWYCLLLIRFVESLIFRHLIYKLQFD